MLDQEYFTKHLVSQINDLGAGSVMANIFLNDRTDYAAQRIIEAHPGYVILSVYPQKDSESAAEGRVKYGDTSGRVYHDQIAVPYSQISHVLLTITKPKNPLQGFVIPKAC